jgi:hypothetical protein
MTLWLVLGKRGPICRAPFGGEHPLDPSATALSLPSSDFRDQVLALADVQVEALSVEGKTDESSSRLLSPVLRTQLQNPFIQSRQMSANGVMNGPCAPTRYSAFRS